MEIIGNREPHELLFRAMLHVGNQIRKYRDVHISLEINRPLHDAHSLLHSCHTLICERILNVHYQI